MNLLEVIRAQVASLPDGPHKLGLESVLRHIGAAHRHLSRGQQEQDDSLFTDAIYRTNQAFEGSLKEAYRVLAGKDPHKTKPYDIEVYLQSNNFFRPRVLSQFTNYRTEWRNKFTHDYNLHSDEDEAFLAIVSVSAFAKLLIDQILEKLAYLAVKEDIGKNPVGADALMVESSNTNFLDRVTSWILAFAETYATLENRPIWLQREAQIIGALAGFISTLNKNIVITADQEILIASGHQTLRADIVVREGKQSVVVEIKLFRSHRSREDGLRHLEAYISNSDIKNGILFMYSKQKETYRVQKIESSDGGAIVVLEAPVQSPAP